MNRSKFYLALLLAAMLGLIACAGGAADTPSGEEPPPAADTPSGEEPADTPEGEEPADTPAGEAETVTLSMILVTPQERWEFLLERAEEKFEADHPGTDIQVDVQFLPFGDRLTQLRAAATAGTPLDIVSLDQPEVGDFAAAGFTTDLSEWISRDLDGLSAYMPAYREATKFQGAWHAIWIWTDARLMWYWKDLVEQAGVDPATMLTWDGYLEGCQALDEALADQNIEGCLLIGQPWIADWTMPYAWMSGGDLGFYVNPELAEAQGATDPWLPTFDSQAWADALTFTGRQVEAGIEPYTEHQFGQEFIARRFAVSLDGTWVYGLVRDSDQDVANAGMIGAFPVPAEGDETATMAGGWTLAIPTTSEHPEMAWEFLKTMVEPDILGDMQTQFGFLPTQSSIAEAKADAFAEFWNEGGVDRWAELEALAPHAYGRPSFPTWPQVATAITEMVQRVQFEGADPSAVAAEAQITVVTEVLGWPEGTTVELHDDSGGSCEHADVDWAFSAITPVQVAADADGNGTVCSHVNVP
ncbi:MAG: extracellular solute-binding protein [Candidatus Promineifilaceae bacterium]